MKLNTYGRSKLKNKINISKGQETAMIDRYVTEISKAAAMIRKKIVWRGLVNSTAQSIPFLGYAIAFTYGVVFLIC